MKKTTIITIIAGIVLTIILVIGSSYAMFYSESNFTNEMSYTSGILDIELVDEEGYNTDISLTNTLPKSDEEGRNSSPYRLKLRNNGDLTYTFDVKLINTTTENSVDLNYVKISINQGAATTISELTDNIIAKGVSLNPKEEITYDIRIWLDENTPNSEMGKNFQADISTYGVGSEYTPPEVFQLNISKGAITIDEGSDSTKLYINGGGLSEQTEIDNTLPIYITGSATNNGGILVNSGTVNITLNNTNISGASGTFMIMSGANVNLTISGSNILNASSGSSISRTGNGIHVASGATLTINGTGILNATGAGSGIGGGYMLAAGTIIINEGTINASSTATGAGIGGYGIDLIEINGGNITATGYDYGTGLEGGAGIGGCKEASITGWIRINGGTVYAKGGSGAAGIGGGGPMAMSCMLATAPNIEISDNANVTAINGGSDAEDIGNGGFSC